jgi:squalene-associated FAD-dependent desaturase
MADDSANRVAIVGGGLAGLAATVALAARGFRVSLLEARGRLGGRASSFHDPVSNQLIDACQHVSMGACTNFANFCRTVGIDRYLAPQKCLYFMTPDRRVSRFEATTLPAPLHLAASFGRAHFLSVTDKLRIAFGLERLRRSDSTSDPPFAEWLTKNYQSPRTVDRFWGVVLTSALNETPDRVGLRYARKVFIDGFLRHRRGFEVELPTVPLASLYGAELTRWLDAHGVALRLNQAARELATSRDRIQAIVCRDGSTVEADWFVLAVPFERVVELLPPLVIDRDPRLKRIDQLQASPITSVHLWYDRPVLRWPHVVLVDCVGQWVFNRGVSARGQHYVQVVVSAARQFRGLGHAEVLRTVTEEMHRLFPEAMPSALLRGRVVTEHAATFSALPGIDHYRPSQAMATPNLFLAGDWTATGWPATMEGAVRSGYLAAEALLLKVNRPETLIQPDL